MTTHEKPTTQPAPAAPAVPSAPAARGIARYLWAVVFGVNALLLAATAYMMVESRLHHEDMARQLGNNLTHLLAQDVGADYQRLDVALREVATEFADFKPQGDAAVVRWLDSIKARYGSIDDLRIAAADGTVVYESGAAVVRPVKLGDRDYFLRLRDDPAAGLQISVPLVGRLTGRTVVVLARRIDDAQGRFAGAALGSVSPSRLRSKFGALQIGERDVLAVRDAAFRAVAQYPDADTDALAPFAESFRAALAAKPDTGELILPGSSDGERRLLVYTRNAVYGFYVVACLSEDVYLADWHREARTAVTLLVLFLIGSAALAVQLNRAWRRQAESAAALLRQDELLADAQRIGRFAHGSYDLTRDRWEASPSLFELFGVPADHPRTFDGYLDLIHPDDRTAFAASFRDTVVDRGEALVREYRLVRPSDGEVRWVAGVIRRGERADTVFGLALDITERRRAEEALKRELAEKTRLNEQLEQAQSQLLQSEKMASIGQLAAGVAHELNNPIGFIQSNLGTLAGYVDDLLEILDESERCAEHCPVPARVEALRRIKAEKDSDFIRQDIRQLLAESKDGANRVRRIVQNLKDFSHVSEDEWVWSDLHLGLDSTLTIVWNEIKYKAEVEKSYGSLPAVYCMPNQINQVFMNLLVNAAQAIESRGKIVLRTGADERGVWVEVQDNGKGIPPENLKRVFDPFFTTKPVGKGTGLGLSLAWSIVEKHHGKLTVDSAVGVGTTFRVALPLNGQLGDGGATVSENDQT